MWQTNQSGVAYCQFMCRVEPVKKTCELHFGTAVWPAGCVSAPATNPTCKQYFLVTNSQAFDIVTPYFNACGN
jgi:hypothetical protein